MEQKSPELARIFGEEPRLEHLATGFGFTEGPVWRGDHLLFSDIPRSRIVRYQDQDDGPAISTFRFPSGNANGQTLDRQGRLLTCEHSNRRVTRTEPDGSVTVLASRFEVGLLNSPNDVVARSDGSIYFTDPPYGLANHSRDKQHAFCGVFRMGPNGEALTLLLDSYARPNGLAFSPDESTLYVADSQPKLIMAYDVAADGSLQNERRFAELPSADGEEGVPDGMKVDTEGNVYSTGPGGLWVFGPDGTPFGRLRTPTVPANCAWGDADSRSLYLTARTELYRIRVSVPGIVV
jgi:gluconolactonase